MKVNVGRMNETIRLKEKLSSLIIDQRKDLTTREVVRVSQKLDRLIVKQMKERNGLNKQLCFFSDYN